MKTKAIVFTSMGQVEVLTVDVPEPGPGEVLVETAFSAVSPGTEMRCLAGTQTGLESYPVVPGYSIVGHVMSRGSGVTVEVGTLVWVLGTARCSVSPLWGGHVGHAVAKAETVFPLPDGISLPEATLIKLAAITYRGVRLSNPKPCESVVVFGLGPIGHIAARLHALSGARVVGADPMSARSEKLSNYGLEAVHASPADLVSAVRERLPDGADVLVDATGSLAAGPGIVSLARDIPWGHCTDVGARYVVQGSYVGGFTVPYDEAFRKELSVYFTRDARPDDTRIIISLLATSQLSLSGIAELAPVHQAPSVYRDLVNRRPDLLTAVFDWNL